MYKNKINYITYEEMQEIFKKTEIKKTLSSDTLQSQEIYEKQEKQNFNNLYNYNNIYEYLQKKYEKNIKFMKEKIKLVELGKKLLKDF